MIDGIAIAIGATASQVVLAWALQRAPNVLLISGTTSIAHLEQIFRASQMRLTDEQFARISAVDIG